MLEGKKGIISIENLDIIPFCDTKDCLNQMENDINISSMFENSYSIFKMLYEIEKPKTLKILDSTFVRNNKGRCKMIINNKANNLIDKYPITNNKINKLKIKLIITNNQGINLSRMFYNCKSLKIFSEISQGEPISEILLKEENNNNDVEIKNKSDSVGLESDSLFHQFYGFDSISSEISKKISFN